MLIHELSIKTGLSPHTIRFYEKSGLVKGKRDITVKSNNYFHYDEETVEKLEFINDAKSVGFTISEIGQIIDAWYNNKYSKKDEITLNFLDPNLKVLFSNKDKIISSTKDKKGLRLNELSKIL